jgi:ubiquinone biosynthesis protein
LSSKFNKSIRHLSRYQEILRILVKYGFWDIVSKIKIGLLPDIAQKIIPHTRKKEFAALDTPIRLRMAFEELGATFIKLGQMLSLRPDLIPPKIAQEFSKLQDNIPPDNFEDIKSLIEEEYHQSLYDVFAEFDENALAAASMAQVHKAKLKSGEEVAVKVLHPGIGKLIETDMEILLNLAHLIEKHIPESRLYDPVGIVNEFKRTIQKEQRLIYEGRNIETFRRYTEDDPTVKVPLVYWEYSTEKVLVTEMVKGIKISDLESMDNAEIDRKQVAENGAKTLLKQIFEYGFFHADPHPGNIFVLPGNVLAPVDFGMVGRIDEEMKDDLLDILKGIVDKDVYRIAHTLLQIGMVEDQINKRDLQRDLLDFLDHYYGIPLNNLNTAQLLNEFMELVRKHQIKLPSDIVMMGRAIVISEAVGRNLYPQFNLFELLIPFTRKIFINRLNPFNRYRQLIRIFEQSVDTLKGLPESVQNILYKLRNDKLKVTFYHDGLENFTRELDRSSNRIAFALIIASLIVGSSLVIQIDKGPALWGYPAFGILGYVVASILGIWLIIAILRSGKL